MAGLLDYLSQFGNGVVQGGNEVGAGVAQMGIGALNKLGVMGPDAVKRNQQIIAQQEEAMKNNNGMAGRVGQAVGNFLPLAAVPGLPIEGVTGKLISGVVNGALGDAVLPTKPGGPSRLDNIKKGAILGGGFGMAGAGLTKGAEEMAPTGIDRFAQALHNLHPEKAIDKFTPTQGVTQGYVEKSQEGEPPHVNDQNDQKKNPASNFHPTSLLMQMPADQRQQAVGIANILDHTGPQGQALIQGLVDHPNGDQFFYNAGMLQPGTDAMNQLTAQAANALRTRLLMS